MPFPKDESRSAPPRTGSGGASADRYAAIDRAVRRPPRTTSRPYSNPPQQQTPPPPVTSNSTGQYAGARNNRQDRQGGRGRLTGGSIRDKIENGRPGNGKGRGSQFDLGPGEPGGITGKTETGPGGRRNNGRNGEGKGQGAIQKYLAGDATFQDQMSLLQKQLEDYTLSNQNERGDVRGTFRTAMDRMKSERGRAHESMENDFASRGLLTSGMYTDAVQDYDDQFQDKTTDLTTDRDQTLQQLLEQLGMNRTTNQGAGQTARQQAIQRRAEQLGLKLGG